MEFDDTHDMIHLSSEINDIYTTYTVFRRAETLKQKPKKNPSQLKKIQLNEKKNPTQLKKESKPTKKRIQLN